jgi:hypothetical protein
MARKKRAATVSLKDLMVAMKEVIELGDRDVDKNVAAVAERVGLQPGTVKTRIRNSRMEVPHLRLLDLSYFLGTPGQRKETHDEEELNEFVAELFDKPLEDVEAELEDAKVELEEDLEKRKKRKKREPATASTASE